MVTVNPDSGASTQTGGRMAERGIAYEPEGALREPLLAIKFCLQGDLKQAEISFQTILRTP